MIDDAMDYGGSNGAYRQQPPLRPPPMVPPTGVRQSAFSPRFDNIMSRSSSVPWSPVPVDGNPYDKPTMDPLSNSNMYRKQSDIWTTNPNMKPSDGWMNSNIYTKSSEVWNNNNAQSRPLEPWSPSNNSRVRPSEPWQTNYNVQSKQTDSWQMNNNPQHRQTEQWSSSNNYSQPRPTEQWQPNIHSPSRHTEPWSPSFNVPPTKPAEPWSPTYNSPSKLGEPRSPNNNLQSKSDAFLSTNTNQKRNESTIMSNTSSNLPMVNSADKKPGCCGDRCSPNCKLGLLGFTIGFLAVGIAVAVVLVLWLRQ